MAVQDRRKKGREFHIVGAAKVKERRPIAVRISGTARSKESEERRVRKGL